MSCPHGNPIGGCDICDEVDAAFEAGKQSALADQPAPVQQEPDAFVQREAIRTLSGGANHVPATLTLNDDGGKAVAVFLSPQPAPVQQCMDHGECFGGKCIYPAPQPAQQQEPVGTVRELFTQAAWEKLDVRGSTKVYFGAPQPAQQEPVAWMFEDDEDNGHKTFRQTPPSPEAVAYLAKWNRPAWVPLYTSPAAQRKQVGDSRFESWYSEDFDPKGKGTKQQMREAYEAGMNDSAPQPAQRTWIDPNDKTQKQYLPHIGEPVLFCHGGKIYTGKHTGGSFQSEVTNQYFNTWECHWMYLPSAHGIKEQP